MEHVALTHSTGEPLSFERVKGMKKKSLWLIHTIVQESLPGRLHKPDKALSVGSECFCNLWQAPIT